MQRRIRAGMVVTLEQRETPLENARVSAKAELAALKVWLKEPEFVARLLRGLLVDDPNLQAMATEILEAIQDRNRELTTPSD